MEVKALSEGEPMLWLLQQFADEHYQLEQTHVALNRWFKVTEFLSTNKYALKMVEGSLGDHTPYLVLRYLRRQAFAEEMMEITPVAKPMTKSVIAGF